MAKQRVWVKVLSQDDKAEIAAVCERFIADVIRPRFLPEIAQMKAAKEAG